MPTTNAATRPGADRPPLACHECGGDGRVESADFSGRNNPEYNDAECEACGGTGEVPCSDCGSPATVERYGNAYCDDCAERVPRDRAEDAAEKFDREED